MAKKLFSSKQRDFIPVEKKANRRKVHFQKQIVVIIKKKVKTYNS